jgi:hypothetical protein
MRIYREHEVFADGDTFTPRELNEELRSVIHEFNTGLDRDNLGITLPSSRLHINSVMSRHFEETGVVRSATKPADAPTGQLYPVPNAAGTPTQVVFTCVDGYLVVEASVTFGTAGAAFEPGPAFMAILVDGEVLGRTGANLDAIKFQGKYLKVYKEVGAGNHLIEVKWGVVAGTAAQVFDFRGRCFRVRHGKR